MTDDQVALMRIAARSVVEESAVGRSVDPHRLEWAQHILAHCQERVSPPDADPFAPAHSPEAA